MSRASEKAKKTNVEIVGYLDTPEAEFQDLYVLRHLGQHMHYVCGGHSERATLSVPAM